MHAAACMPDALLMHDPKPLRTPLTGPLLNIAELFSQCSAASQHSPNFMHDLNRNQSKDQRHKRRDWTGRDVVGGDRQSEVVKVDKGRCRFTGRRGTHSSLDTVIHPAISHWVAEA